jgi:hypothetical protein
MTALQEFTEVFRAEHRQVRDLLLDLARAFRDRDIQRARSLAADVAAATGPHFWYEEEAMYPELTGIFGEAYVAKLLADHDGAIGNTREILWLAGNETLTEEQAEHGAGLARQILPHVSDCDGLTIMVETLPDDVVSQILAARSAALETSLDLLTWAATTRARKS